MTVFYNPRLDILGYEIGNLIYTGESIFFVRTKEWKLL